MHRTETSEARWSELGPPAPLLKKGVQEHLLTCAATPIKADKQNISNDKSC